MNEQFYENLSLVSTFLIVVPFAVACVRWRRLVKTQKRLACLVAVVAIVELVANLLWRQYINNHPVYHVYSILEFLIILSIYSSYFDRTRINKVFFILGTSFTLFALANMLLWQSPLEFNSNVTLTSSALIIMLSLSSFYRMLIGPVYTTLHLIPIFWISAGLLLYFSSNIVLFYLGSRVELTYEDSLPIWGLHSIFNCLLILFFTVALWIQPKKG